MPAFCCYDVTLYLSGRLEVLHQQHQKGAFGKQSRNVRTPQPPGTTEVLTRTTKSRRPKTVGPATQESEIVLCNAAVVPLLPSSFLRNEKVAPYLSFFSSYGVRQPPQIEHKRVHSLPSSSCTDGPCSQPGSASLKGDSCIPFTSQHHFLSQAFSDAGFGADETEVPLVSQPCDDSGGDTCAASLNRSRSFIFESNPRFKTSRTPSPQRASNDWDRSAGTGKTLVEQWESRLEDRRVQKPEGPTALTEQVLQSVSSNSSFSSLKQDGSMGTHAVPPTAWAGLERATKAQRLQRSSSSVKGSETAHTARESRQSTQQFCLSGSALGGRRAGEDSTFRLLPTTAQKHEKNCSKEPSSMQKIVKGSDLVRGRCILEKQLMRTVERKWELLHDLEVKSKALKATNTKLLQTKVTEAKLKQLEMTIDSKIAEMQKPLLSVAFSRSDTLTTLGDDPTEPLQCSPEPQKTENTLHQRISEAAQHSVALRMINSRDELLQTTAEEPSNVLKRNTRSSAASSRLRRGGVRSGNSAKAVHLKTKYVIVVDLAADMGPYLPDIRDELSKLVQQAMLKQHSLFNLIKLGNKVEVCMPSMPRRVEESLLVALDKFIRGLSTAKKRPGTTGLVEGLRKAVLMNPDIIYVISHTPPSDPKQQEECIQLVRDYYRAAEWDMTEGKRRKRPATFRYLAFRKPLQNEAYEQFFYNLCSASLPGVRADAAEKNFFLADRASLWKSILRDTKQAKKLRTKLKKSSQLVTTYKTLEKHVPILREKLHNEAALEKLLRLDFQKCEEAMEKPVSIQPVAATHGKRLQAAASPARNRTKAGGAGGKSKSSSAKKKRKPTTTNSGEGQKTGTSPGTIRRR